MGDDRITVVVATRNRANRLLATLEHLRTLPESPAIVVVDNASDDGTAERLRRVRPDVSVVEVNENLGAAARNLGVERARTPYVAFCDDDSWFAPGTLRRAADRLDAHPRLGLIGFRILVGSDQVLDPTCIAMHRRPLAPHSGLAWPAVLGFLACGAVVRRDAFRQAGGFERRLGVGGEEGLLALDLAAAGWQLVYCDDLVAHHHPEAMGPRPERQRIQARNSLWVAWLRLPTRVALIQSAGPFRRSMRNADDRRALREALAGLPWILRSRKVVPRAVADAYRCLRRATAREPVNPRPVQ